MWKTICCRFWEKNFRLAVQLFFERYGIEKLHVVFACEKRLRVHDQLSIIKRQKANPVVNNDNSVNTAIEVNRHINANTSGVIRSSIQNIGNTKFSSISFNFEYQTFLEADFEHCLIFCEDA